MSLAGAAAQAGAVRPGWALQLVGGVRSAARWLMEPGGGCYPVVAGEIAASAVTAGLAIGREAPRAEPRSPPVEPGRDDQAMRLRNPSTAAAQAAGASSSPTPGSSA